MTDREIPNSSIPPSELMRIRRPENYSDSTHRSAYKLEQSVFGYVLDTLTERNDHNAFEEFCRALAQREICPNLRPQTGPEGGGDGKVDTETYPVADEISERWYEGLPNSGNERWAFAVSAKKAWSSKVRTDVASIVQTGRAYTQIHFFTSRPTRQSDKLRIEDELRKKHGISVTIHDRRWIIDRVFKNEHFDIVHDHLGAGEHDPSAAVVGPNDLRRQQELEQVESRLSGKEEITPFESVSEALYAAKLSRGLERPEIETTGRFERSIRLAEKHGTFHQVLEARYESVWTAFWWHDDFAVVDSEYETIEEIAFKSRLAADVSKVANLYQLVVGKCRADAASKEDYQLDDRGIRLKAKLQRIAEDESGRNNSLHAVTLLALHKLNYDLLNDDAEGAESVWKDLKEIIQRARGLPEYPAEMLESVVKGLSQFNVDSSAFDELLLAIGELMAERQHDGKRGSIFLERGQRKLEAEKPLEAIPWLGKAAVAFLKKEFQDEQYQALYFLAVAYRGVGLPWAARAACLTSLTVLHAINDEEGEIRPQTFAVANLFARLSLEVAHIPDFVAAYRLIGVLEANVSLHESSQAHLANTLSEFDTLLAVAFSGFEEASLPRLSGIPAVLDAMQLYGARSTLLYRLGYLDLLRADGSIPPEASDSEFQNAMCALASQPATHQLPSIPILNDEQDYKIESTILGVKVVLSAESKAHLISTCEVLAASLEGLGATMLGQRIHPVTDHASVSVIEVPSDQALKVVSQPHDMKVSLELPVGYDIGDHRNIEEVQERLIEFAAIMLGTVAMAENLPDLLEYLCAEERAFERCTIFSNVGATHSRVFGTQTTKLSDFYVPELKDYPLQPDAPKVVALTVRRHDGGDDGTLDFVDTLSHHSQVEVHTIINPHLWNDAGWCATGYASFGENYPPIIGLQFRQPELGLKIFEQLRDKIGPVDESEAIRLAILLGIDRDNPFHYRVHVSAERASLDVGYDPSKLQLSLSRHNSMTATTHKHLDFFRDAYSRTGVYFFAPFVPLNNGQLVPVQELAIKKKDFHITEAWRVDLQHQEAPIIMHDDRVIVPEDEANPPIEHLLQAKRALNARR